ncbi:bifunctional tetrahydrofolate synthase/dihydrofolate synthase [Bowmanella dokdonensis]|uniref:Dihydrofolate synthase/folylpolyglutamate synthase n=1 Tax=Bowmanella dokdonensis TaxID=751969 RepID=A0A939DPR8_9ALTE|nr:bifunctional tetrahydrofolate synthase/dihydrofolate synthase [Bowmanella dokdonensis]MBN7826714.1 bifunctional tetrahydrofolate synthase/dihydrofolate synthase [Bowmanella dokdonensis]
MSYPAHQQPSTLEGWLRYLESIHPATIDMGLERVNEVFVRLKLDFSRIRVVTVGGTNGKGTTCAMLEQGALLAGKSTAVYSSPHILDYRERVRINGVLLDEQAHCQAFAIVEAARGETSLTYFEFGTLAALVLIARHRPDFAILEVGLGGRLDAVNILAPELAIITTIDLDHQDWLGDTRELIAAEKAGIFRAHGLAIIGEPNPPDNLIGICQQLEVRACWQGQDFSYRLDKGQFVWQDREGNGVQGPIPAIPAANASTALCALKLLGLLDKLEASRLLSSVRLPGRCQLIASRPDILVDVAHNPQAAGYLASQIRARQWQKLHLVVGMLKDKDIRSSLAVFTEFEPVWHLASLGPPRGASSGQLHALLPAGQSVIDYDSVTEAFIQARRQAKEQDLILVFGSFLTVAEILALPDLQNKE